MPDRSPNLTVTHPLPGGLFATAGPEPVPLPRVLPGELVRLEATGQMTVLEASPNRVEPGCVHFGECGGCFYQHAAYPAQLAIKQEILATLLEPVAAGVQVRTHPSPPWGYRNRIRLRVRVAAATLELGYSRWRSNEFLPVRMCPIAAPLLWQAAAALIDIVSADARLLRWFNSVSAVELFADGEEASLQLLVLVADADAARADLTALARLADRLHGRIPQLAGAGTEPDPDAPRRARREFEPSAWRSPGLLYPLDGRRYWVPRGAFFQVNRFLLPDLLATGTATALSPSLAWDLFAGVGLFAQALANGGWQVVAVEGAPRAAEALATVARSQVGLEAVNAATLDFLAARQTHRERPALVVLDPPRVGLGRQGAELLARLAPAQITCISCDPAALARDLPPLLAAGYCIDELHLFDLFPQTFHLEVVVKLRLGSQG